MKEIKMIKIDDCVPMHELERDYYDDQNYSYLKRVIERDGLDPAYPIRVLWNKGKRMFEIFDGIHRWRIAHELNYTKIPAFDETALVTRGQALGKGIKANKTHAAYNPMDICYHLKYLAESIKEDMNGGGMKKYNLKALEEMTGIGQKSVSQYLQLDRLPQDAKDLVGEGKIRFNVALVLLRLDKTKHRGEISDLANRAYSGGWSVMTVRAKVSAVLSGVGDMRVCQGCRKAFPSEELKPRFFCPSCRQIGYGGKDEGDKELRLRRALMELYHVDESQIATLKELAVRNESTLVVECRKAFL